MRLMLGTNNQPSLLVSVERWPQHHQINQLDFWPDLHFDFWVINGAWNGSYSNSRVLVEHTQKWLDDEFQILCDDQSRLGGDYQDVFRNFHDVNYRSPEPKPVDHSIFDDAIPF